MVEELKSAFLSHGWKVETEFFCRRNGVTTFFDVYAVKGRREVAVEVETSVRHVVDNVRKAQAVGIDVWIVVPSRKLQRVVGTCPSRDIAGIPALLVGEVGSILDLDDPRTSVDLQSQDRGVWE